MIYTKVCGTLQNYAQLYRIRNQIRKTMQKSASKSAKLCMNPYPHPHVQTFQLQNPHPHSHQQVQTFALSLSANFGSDFALVCFGGEALNLSCALGALLSRYGPGGTPRTLEPKAWNFTVTTCLIKYLRKY